MYAMSNESRRQVEDDAVYADVPACIFVEVEIPRRHHRPWWKTLLIMPLSLPFLTFVSVLPIAGIAISLVKFDECPSMPVIPKFLILHGLWFLFLLCVKSARYFTADSSLFMRYLDGIVTSIELGILCFVLNLCIVAFSFFGGNPSGDNRRRPEGRKMQCDECVWYILLITAVLFAFFLFVFLILLTCSAFCCYSCSSGNVKDEAEKGTKDGKFRKETKSEKTEESVAFAV